MTSTSLTATTTGTQTYLKPGQHVSIRLPWSEVCMHMRVADTVMDVELTEGPYPMAQLWKDGRRFSFPVTCGEAGIYRQHDGLFYAYAEATS